MTMPFTPCEQNAGESCSDVSVGILTKIFGDAIPQLASGGDPSALTPASSVLASMMTSFNSGILVVAGLILAYIATVGVVNTANDGEAFGKNWSSVWTPVRVVSGFTALIPAASGYSYIQLVVMTLALWSIGFANGVFKIGVENGIVGGTLSSVSSELGMGTGAKANPKYPLYDLRKFGSDFLAIAWCERTVTETFAKNVATGTEKPVISISENGQADSVQMESENKRGSLFLYKDRNTASNLGGGLAICGSIKLYEYSTPSAIAVVPSAGSAFDAGTINSNAKAMMAIRQAALKAKKTAASKMMSDIREWVASWPSELSVADGETPTWDSVSADRFNAILNDAQASMISELNAQINNDTVLKKIMEKYTSDITKDGWAMAGGFYQRMGGLREEMGDIFSEAVYTASKPDLSAVPGGTIGDYVKDSYFSIYDTLISKTLNGVSYNSGSLSGDLNSFRGLFGTDIKGLSIDSIGNRSSGFLSSAVGNLMQGSIDTLIGTDGHVDMLARIKTLGDSLKLADTAIGVVIYDVNLTIDAAQILAAGAGSVKVFGTGIDAVPLVDGVRRLFTDAFATRLAEISSWLGRLAFWFGIFIPTLPYFIFMIAVVGWLLSVLQALVAAPLWAIMHMTPERSFIGGQHQGYLLLLSLFARPALIVIGLFAAMLLANPIIEYVTIFFFAVRTANVTSSESLGWFMQFLTFKDWLLMYAFVITPIVYMVFGLSQSLPDTVLSWIGAGIRSMGETNATGEMRAAMIGHDASSAITSSSSAASLPRNKSGGALPPGASSSSNGGGGGASPSYGTGTNSTPPSPTPKPQNGGAKLLNANPQGVAPTPATPPPAQVPGFTAKSERSTDNVLGTQIDKLPPER
ncbi:MAG TPA: DotA/TraY family protein [Nitrosomonas sp.]|nr:DotA/TraY family protein [Nitrosomonas sp.]